MRRTDTIKVIIVAFILVLIVTLVNQRPSIPGTPVLPREFSTSTGGTRYVYDHAYSLVLDNRWGVTDIGNSEAAAGQRIDVSDGVAEVRIYCRRLPKLDNDNDSVLKAVRDNAVYLRPAGAKEHNSTFHSMPAIELTEETRNPGRLGHLPTNVLFSHAIIVTGWNGHLMSIDYAYPPGNKEEQAAVEKLIQSIFVINDRQ
jgi:hypothetical protein